MRKKGKMKRNRKSLKVRIILAVIIIFVLILGYMFVEPYWLKITEYEIYDSKIPIAFDGYEILFVSDIHHGPFFSYERVESLVEKMNEMDADLILMGGDYVHRGPTYVQPVFEAMKGITAKDGVYGVLGNHDHWDGEAEARLGFQNAGIIDIENNTISIVKNDERINISGVGDYNEGVYSYSNDSENYSILVSHNPDFVAEIQSNKPDLMLCGHTHGGQVTFFGLWAPFVSSKYGNRFRYGEVIYNDINMIITSGVGTITPPVRFFARPEIVKIILRSGEQN